MNPRQRTIVRLAVCAVLLAFMAPRLLQFYESPQSALTVGVSLVFVGILAFAIEPRLYKSAPKIDEQLTAAWGYSPPRWVKTAVNILMIVAGLASIIWSFRY